ncbi:uncharacterized protein LOC118436157 [Folsomia candida]|nr:uncharacterized protein LOC118436157 [Folsomia candida]
MQSEDVDLDDSDESESENRPVFVSSSTSPPPKPFIFNRRKVIFPQNQKVKFFHSDPTISHDIQKVIENRTYEMSYPLKNRGRPYLEPSPRRKFRTNSTSSSESKVSVSSSVSRESEDFVEQELSPDLSLADDNNVTTMNTEQSQINQKKSDVAVLSDKNNQTIRAFTNPMFVSESEIDDDSATNATAFSSSSLNESEQDSISANNTHNASEDFTDSQVTNDDEPNVYNNGESRQQSDEPDYNELSHDSQKIQHDDMDSTMSSSSATIVVSSTDNDAYYHQESDPHSETPTEMTSTTTTTTKPRRKFERKFFPISTLTKKPAIRRPVQPSTISKHIPDPDPDTTYSSSSSASSDLIKSDPPLDPIEISDLKATSQPDFELETQIEAPSTTEFDSFEATAPTKPEILDYSPTTNTSLETYEESGSAENNSSFSDSKEIGAGYRLKIYSKNDFEIKSSQEYVPTAQEIAIAKEGGAKSGGNLEFILPRRAVPLTPHSNFNYKPFSLPNAEPLIGKSLTNKEKRRMMRRLRNMRRVRPSIFTSHHHNCNTPPPFKIDDRSQQSSSLPVILKVANATMLAASVVNSTTLSNIKTDEEILTKSDENATTTPIIPSENIPQRRRRINLGPKSPPPNKTFSVAEWRRRQRQRLLKHKRIKSNRPSQFTDSAA